VAIRVEQERHAFIAICYALRMSGLIGIYKIFA